MKTAVIAGATGLVGRELLSRLLNSQRYDKVVALTRRDFPVTHPKLEKLIIDFVHSGQALAGHRPDDVYCALGTTMAKAGSKENFYAVDFEYPVALAKATLGLGARQYLLVSALGANKTSAVYYNRVKGEVEEAVREVGFETLHIFRPSLLLGSRTEKRPGEDVAKTLYKIFGFLIPERYKAIDAGVVAQAMVDSASEESSGVTIHESRQMQRLG